MSRIGVQVNLANRIKRVGNYTELYLCKKMFSYICYDFSRYSDKLDKLVWLNKHGIVIANKTYEWHIEINARSGEIIYIDDTSKIVRLYRKRRHMTEESRRLYNQLDFNELYWHELNNPIQHLNLFYSNG
jgi:hypothetical protein